MGSLKTVLHEVGNRIERSRKLKRRRVKNFLFWSILGDEHNYNKTVLQSVKVKSVRTAVNGSFVIGILKFASIVV